MTSNPDTALRLVVKVGTSVLTAGTDSLNQPFMVDLVRQVAVLHGQQAEVLLVSSGAVAAGWERLDFPPRQQRNHTAVAFRQMLAAVGQSRLMHLYEQFFNIYGLKVAQALLTRGDLRDRHRYLNARNALMQCLRYRLIPIINENDAVATSEIRLGDNDTLSAYVANLVDADLLVILSDVQGLYTADPRTHPQAELLHVVEQIDEQIWAMAGGSGTHRGTGGMATKIRAADLATRSGCEVVIASGFEPECLLRVVRGETLGTRFRTSVSQLEARKRWLLAETVMQSRIEVDDGAVRALVEQGKSLLPAGVTAVAGEFERGQTIRIFARSGREIARGMTQYSASDLALIRGLRSAQVAELLGYDYGTELVHRDDMVLL